MVLIIMLGFFITIMSLLSKCTGVGIEYYDDKNLPEEQTEDFLRIIPRTRQIDNEDILKISNIWEHNDNVTDYRKSSNTEKYNIMRDDLHITNYETTLSNLSTSDNSRMLKTTMFPLDTLKEYEYIYDDEPKPYVLREKITKHTEKNISGGNIKTSLLELYNLEPAVNLMDLNVEYDTYSKVYSVWYVVEDLPCWELPVLYGEFGKQKKSCEVFLMHGGEVKNVVENKSKEKWQSIRKNTSVPLTYYTNKWCKTAPCYGDHTLCLFSDQYMSGMCDDSYKVEVPNILEQTALINTINSMRNKIANGESGRYAHLPTAANMKQIIYDNDLENFARVWLLQCIPGPEACSALDGTFVNQLECTKFAKFCCVNSFSARTKKCTPRAECYIPPVIGCLHVWFWKAGDNLSIKDVQCGHTSVLSYTTAQILWATTYKVGCAYGKSSNGNVRVICNFSPGAPFLLDGRLYCGILSLKGGTEVPNEKNISDATFLKPFGININENFETQETKRNNMNGSKESKLKFDEATNVRWGIDILHKMYTKGRIRKELKDYTNGTRDMIARSVVKYKFIELNGAKCDSGEPIYIIGAPGSLCIENGRRYQGLCYDFRDPTPGYRVVAVIAPIALFSLILYDLFSGIVRQTNY